jgi:hypothetical protein
MLGDGFAFTAAHFPALLSPLPYGTPLCALRSSIRRSSLPPIRVPVLGKRNLVYKLAWPPLRACAFPRLVSCFLAVRFIAFLTLARPIAPSAPLPSPGEEGH